MIEILRKYFSGRISDRNCEKILTFLDSPRVEIPREGGQLVVGVCDSHNHCSCACPRRTAVVNGIDLNRKDITVT